MKELKLMNKKMEELKTVKEAGEINLPANDKNNEVIFEAQKQCYEEISKDWLNVKKKPNIL